MKRLVSLLSLAAAWLLAASVATATPITFVTDLSGLSESPPNASPGTGHAVVVIDPTAHTLSVHVVFSDLLGNTTASHIHCCTAVPGAGNAGVATAVPTFPGFPLGVTAGTYDQTFDMTLASSWNPAFVTAHGGIAGAEAFFLAGLLAGTTYFNIHSTMFTGGEIRGFLVAPEPTTLALLGVALAGLGCVRRRAHAIRA